MSTLKELLDSKKCFKLVCGAGNTNLEGIKSLIELYYKAGCRYFDLSMSKEVVELAKKTVPDAFLCVSTGIKDDPHLNKAKIIAKKCVKCGLCEKVCPQNAIYDSQSCIGCGKCKEICPNNAIEMYAQKINIRELLPEILAYNPDCIELHAIGEDEKTVEDDWNYIQSQYNGMMSLCLDRSKLSNEKIIERIKHLIKDRKPYTTIIQADGAPMSGGKDDYRTTLQAIAMADIVQKANLPVYLTISGGTNSKSLKLAKQCGLDLNGVAIGTYARSLKTLEQAKSLIQSCIE